MADNSDQDISYLFPATQPQSQQPAHEDNIDFLFPNSQPQSEAEKNMIENRQKQMDLEHGALLGGAASGAGYVARQAVGQGVDWLKQQALDLMQKQAGNGTSPGGKWFRDVIGDSNYTPPTDDTSVKEAAQIYQRQKAQGKITSNLEKKYGKATPGRLSIQGASAFPEAPAEPIPETSWWDTPGGKMVSGAGNMVPNFLKDVGYGALHGINIANQAGNVAKAPDTMSGALHGASAVGSGLDILSSVAPEATRMGMRQIGGPLAKYGMAVGDIYDELKNGEYGKAAITLGATPMFNSALTTPLGIAALYYRDRPEEFQQAIHTPEPKKPFRYRGFGLD